MRASSEPKLQTNHLSKSRRTWFLTASV